MSIAPHLSDSEHWHRRAEASCALAELMTDETLKKMMLTIAEDFEKIAARVSCPLSASGSDGAPSRSLQFFC